MRARLEQVISLPQLPSGAFYLEGLTDLAKYNWVFDQVHELALSPGKSRSLLATVVKQLCGTEREDRVHEMDLEWRKSSFSGGEGGQCVEVAATADGGRYLRGTKDRSRPAHSLHRLRLGRGRPWRQERRV
jgi:hypothetical protein